MLAKAGALAIDYAGNNGISAWGGFCRLRARKAAKFLAETTHKD